MGQLMHDALGIGLAATQVGRHAPRARLPRRADAPVAALVNPVIEWAEQGRRRRSRRAACRCPASLVDVERPVHVRVRGAGRARRGRSSIEASGLEARVIQHEIDHLDGVLILDRTSRDQRKEAMRALREQLAEGSRARRGLS